MRRLCLIIFVIPAAVGFDVPAVDLNRGRFPSHPPSASQPGWRQRQQRIHTPLGYTHTNRLTQGYFTSEEKSLCVFVNLLPILTLKRSCIYKPAVTPPPPRTSQSRQSSVGDVEPLIGRGFISVLSIWWEQGLHGLFGASLRADTKGC